MRQEECPAAISCKSEFIQNFFWMTTFLDFFVVFFPHAAELLAASYASYWYYNINHLKILFLYTFILFRFLNAFKVDITRFDRVLLSPYVLVHIS